MADVTSANRNLRAVQMSVEDRRWMEVDERIASTEASLEGLTDDEKAPIVAELTRLRQVAEDARNAQRGRELADSIDRNIRAADPQYNAPDTVASYAARATGMLESEDARHLSAADIQTFRQRIAALLGDSADVEKKRAIENATPRVVELEERLASEPFTGLDEVAARHLWQELHALLVAARNNWKDLPTDDADARALGERIDAMDAALAGAAAMWERSEGVTQIVDSWRKTEAEFTGWEEETPYPAWEGLTEGHQGFDELLPRTLRALHDAWSWKYDSLMLRDVREQFSEDQTVRATEAAVEKTIADAGERLWQAFAGVMDEADRAPTPEDRRDLDKPRFVLHRVDQWFGKSEHVEPARDRAQTLLEKWEHAVDELDRMGLELYRKLEAEANAEWPAIVASVAVEPGFTPAGVANFRNKTVLFNSVRNRSGWDFDSAYDLAMWIGDVPVAGRYEPVIADTLADVARRTRTHVDDHTDWDVLCVIEGTGSINERVTREVRIADTNERFKIEEHVPRDCVTVRVVGIRAGAVAVGPQ